MLIGAVFFVGEVGADPVDKLAQMKKVNLVMAELTNIANQRLLLHQKGVTTFSDAPIVQLAENQTSFDVLFQLAVMTHAQSYPGKAEDQVVDDVMDTMWALCLSRIEKLGGAQAIDTLESINRQVRLQGGDLVLYHETLSRLQAANKKRKMAK